MKKISQAQIESNSAPGGFAAAVRQVAAQAMQLQTPMPAPITRSALVETLLAEVKTRVGIAPNSRLETAAFARTLARSALLEPIERLPIFGPALASALGRSFALAQLDLAISVAGLGEPWDRN